MMESTSCAEDRERTRLYHERRREENLRQGLCAKCGRRPVRAGRRTCSECAESGRMRAAVAYCEKLLNRDRRCPTCGERIQPGDVHVKCETCRSEEMRRKADRRETRAEVARERYRKKLASGGAVR